MAAARLQLVEHFIHQYVIEYTSMYKANLNYGTKYIYKIFTVLTFSLQVTNKKKLTYEISSLLPLSACLLPR